MTLVGYCNEGVLFSWTSARTGHSGSFKSAGFHFSTPKDRMSMEGWRKLVTISESHPLSALLFELEGGRWIAARKTQRESRVGREEQESCQELMKDLLLGSDLRIF